MLRSWIMQDSLDILVAERDGFEGISFTEDFRRSYFRLRQMGDAPRIAFFHVVRSELYHRTPRGFQAELSSRFDNGPTLAEWEAHRPLGNVVWV